MMNNKEIDYTARPAPGDYEGRSHRACVWYNRARAAFDLATLDTLTTAADKAAAKKVDSAKIPEQVKKLVISIGNNWAKYTSDAFAFLLRDAGVLVEGSTHFKEG